jgi:ATP:ADP antiporter, AAA family
MKSARALQRLVATILRPFTKVQPQEAFTVALMTLTAFLLLTAYYLLKTVREPLILLQGGAEVKLYARAGQAVIMVGVVHVYGELARRVGRAKLLATVFLFFISNLAVFTFLARTELQIGLAFFLWVGVFSYTVVAQFWALAADIYSEEQGKRLFPILGGGSSVGAVVGSRLAKALVPYGPSVLMGAGVVILLACVALILWIERRCAASVKVEKARVEEPLSNESAIHLLARDKYLLLIAGMVVLLNWVNSSGEYVLDRTLLVAARAATSDPAAAQAYVGAFKADYFAWYNLIGVLLQLFAVSRILAVVGVRRALFVMPVFAFGAYGAAMLAPVLGVMRLVKIGENGIQYSLQDTTRHALFLVTSRVEKFVGKTAVDTVAVRLGAIMSAVMALVGTHLGWSTTVFAALNVGLAVGWIGFVVAIGKEHARRSAEPHEAVPEPAPA